MNFRRHLSTTAQCFFIMLAAVAAGVAAPTETPASSPWSPAELYKGYMVFQHSTLEGVTPGHVPSRATIASTVSCALARGETGSVQIGIHAVGDNLENIRVTVTSDLLVSVHHRIEPATMQ